MSGRPEAGGDAWDATSSDVPDDWTPWRPGDESAAGEAPADFAADGMPAGRDLRGWTPDRTQEVPGPPPDSGAQPAERRGRWWTEDAPARYREGQQVRSTGAVGSGAFFARVPAGTRGEVVSTRNGLMGGEYLTVRFDNGYTEDVKRDDIQRDSWF